jgi:predicted TIM-barrel fold metal-dependent hydrolase
LAEDHLDRYEIEYAVLNPGSTLGLSGIPDVDLACDLAHATNEWTVNDWFPADSRYLGSILISPRDPEWSAQEIRRVGSNPRMVQVTTNWAPCLLGSRDMHAIYEACDEMGLPFNLHVGGADGGINDGSYATGRPTTFCEYHTGMCVPAMHHVISLVTEGVFVKYPKMRVIFNEFGSTWLPFVLWRLDAEYRAHREDVPWLTKLPSEYIKEHIRFTTQPLEGPANPDDLVKLLSVMNGDTCLLFSSDYPHWDFDNPAMVLKGFPDEWKVKIFHDNAMEVFNLAERLRVPAAGVALDG